MKTKTSKMLPKTMPGTVHAQFVRCGKANCKCAGGELHGAYYYHFVRVDGKLRKRYLKASEVERTQAGCSARQQEEKREIAMNRKIWELFRSLRDELRRTPDLY